MPTRGARSAGKAPAKVKDYKTTITSFEYYKNHADIGGNPGACYFVHLCYLEGVGSESTGAKIIKNAELAQEYLDRANKPLLEKTTLDTPSLSNPKITIRQYYKEQFKEYKDLENQRYSAASDLRQATFLPADLAAARASGSLSMPGAASAAPAGILASLAPPMPPMDSFNSYLAWVAKHGTGGFGRS